MSSRSHRRQPYIPLGVDDYLYLRRDDHELFSLVKTNKMHLVAAFRTDKPVACKGIFDPLRWKGGKIIAGLLDRSDGLASRNMLSPQQRAPLFLPPPHFPPRKREGSGGILCRSSRLNWKTPYAD